MKVVYTDAAQQELIDFHERQRLLLERLVSDRKLVFGDDVLEITASDIKEAEHRIQPVQRSVRAYRSSALIVRVYLVTGISMMIGAFFYPQLQEIFETNRTQALVFFTGAAITFMGGIVGYWIKQRQVNLATSLERLDYFAAHLSAAKLEEVEDLKIKREKLSKLE